MQLIETEASVNIKEKMSAVEDQVIEKFEVNKPQEITNGLTDSTSNSDSEILKDTNKVTATQSVEDVKICKENGILKTEASQIDTITESNGKVEHTPCIDSVGDQPMTVSNVIPDTTHPKQNDRCDEDENKDLENTVNSIVNEQAALNDCLDDFSMVDNEDEALKTNDTQAVVNKEDCKDKEITQNIEYTTAETFKSEKMEIDCPLKETLVINNKNVTNDTNIDSKDPILSESKDEPMETENNIGAIESDAMEVQSERIMTAMDPVSKEITECETNKSEVVETAATEKVLTIKDLVEKSDIITDKVELSTTVKSSSAPCDIEITTDQINKPIENHDIDMSEPTPRAIEKQEESAKVAETVVNIESETANVTEITIENSIETKTEKDSKTISANYSEDTKANDTALRTLENIKENTQREFITTGIIENKTIDDAAPKVKDNSDIEAVDSSEKNTADITAAEHVHSSENDTADMTVAEHVHSSENKTTDIIRADHVVSSENDTADKTAAKTVNNSENSTADTTAAKTVNNSENDIADTTAAKNIKNSENNTAVEHVNSSENNTADITAAKTVNNSENNTADITAAKTVNNSENNTADITAVEHVNSSENNTADTTAAKHVNSSENITTIEHIGISESKTDNTTATEIKDISENKTASKIVDSSEDNNIDESKANNEENSKSKTETSYNASAIKELEKDPVKDVLQTKSIDAEIVDISQDKSELSDDACVIVENDDKNEPPIEIMDVDDLETTENKSEISHLTELTELTIVKLAPEIIDLDKDTEQKETKEPKPVVNSTKRTISGLSNTLDILSDDDDDDTTKAKPIDLFDELLKSNGENSNDKNESSQTDKVTKQEKDNTNKISKQDDRCISLDDDDDVMLIDEDSQDHKTSIDGKVDSPAEKKDEAQGDKVKEKMDIKKDSPKAPKAEEKAVAVEMKIEEKPTVPETSTVPEKPKPLIRDNFLKTTKKAIADMTREDLEDLCLEKIAEAIIERNNFGEIKTKLKQMLQNVEEWKNKSMILTKQNKDLQIVLKAIEEEMKKRTNAPIKPLKISRSVGMQVLITETDKPPKKKPQPSKSNSTTPNSSAKSNKQINNQPIPVPILVPANGRSPAKPVPQIRPNSTTAKIPNISNTKSPVTKIAEKRPLSVDSACVDLTDDEPPPKQQVMAKNSVQAPVRVVAQHQLMPQRPAFNQTTQGPRKVYIPINSNGPRPGQIVRAVTVSNNMGPRPRTGTNVVRVTNPNMTTTRTLTQIRHPAPLPTITRQPTNPGWKAIPPAPDLKISKVENGIVISWKIEGYQEDSYEEIASYQLFAYQETQSPPSTMYWKKIGDVKALPLPMACTLTQFMAGYKYFFAVRAVDVKKRIGAFSLPGSILLLTGP